MSTYELVTWMLIAFAGGVAVGIGIQLVRVRSIQT